jgi:hypothetical protein
LSLRSDAVVLRSYVHDNVGLCGPLVSVGDVGTLYNCDEDIDGNGCDSDGITGTNLGNACPTTSPTTVSENPSSSLPCCEELRRNPIFCCLEARNPAFALSVCQECGTGK